MTPPTVETVLPGHSLTSEEGNPSFSAVYLIKADARRILFDCGHPGRRRALLTALNARHLTPDDIDIVVLSHGHWDHIQNVDLFTRARVLIHNEERRYLEEPPPDDHAVPRWAHTVVSHAQPTQDGEEVAPGVRVLHLPGHTPGSIGLTVRVAGHSTVLTGDAVATARVLRGARGRWRDERQAAESVARVRRLADTVYPGHGDPFRVGDAPTLPRPLSFRVPK